VTRKIIIVLAMLLASVACQSKHQPSAQTSAAAHADAAKAQKIIQGCATKSNFLTKTGRKAFYACIAPPGRQKAVEACAQAKLAHAHLFTHAGREAFLNDLGACIK
jgi:hypothetical protein